MTRYFWLLGKRWRLRFVRALRDALGDCDDELREIRVVEGLDGKERLRVMLHELVHAIDWHKDESYVDSVSRSMTNVLWRDGWRRGE